MNTNPTIQNALAHLAAIKDALGTAASKAGSFVADEAKGTLANLAPAAVAARYRAVDQAQQDTADQAARAAGWPGGTAQWAEFDKTQPHPASGNVLGDLAGSIANLYGRIKKKK